MKLVMTLTASIGLAVFAGGCSAALRDAKMWQDDTSKVLATKNDAIRACYDTVLAGTPGVAGKVTINFEVENEGGKIQKVEVDKANTTAPDAVSDCVKKNVEGLVIAPPDAKVGQGSWTYDFSVASSAPAKS